MDTAQTLMPESAQTDRCYGCFRPKRDCFCALIPAIDNETDVLILQHVRERFHPFNTARIVHKALNKSSLLVDQTERLAAAPLPLGPRVGLLYPGPGATLLSDLQWKERPQQLVILDGTWNHVKTLARDIPALHDLPRYQLAPASPGRYRIRREPNATSLSTLEATVAALRILEPDTLGLDQLMDAFDSMIDRQLAHPKEVLGWRRNRRRNRTPLNIPRALTGDLDNVVVAYGESAAGERGRKRVGRPPVYWVAERLGTGECFTSAIQPESPLQESFLAHLELTEEDLGGALSPDEFRTSWAAFLRPGDTLVVYAQSTLRLLKHVGGESAGCLVLKSVSFNPDGQHGTLDELLAAQGLASVPARHPGRAGKRLANAVVLARHLNALGRQSTHHAPRDGI
jgi:tRNA-uridine aminocarboxypropyltransferase